MSTGIGGTKRESTNEGFAKQVGLFEAKIIAINPTIEQYKDILGMELKEDSKAAEYLSERDGNTVLRVDFWLEDVKTGNKFKTNFFLENKERENKDATKQQYINNVGSCSWATDTDDLPEWFAAREYRQAYVGEEDFYSFIKTWLGELDYRNEETTLQIDWKKLMKGNVKDLKDQIDGEWACTIGALATVITKEKEGEVKEYQGIYNRAFLPAYTLKNFKLVDYSNSKVITGLAAKKSKELKPHERFVLSVVGEYGCKDYYTFKDITEYNADDNIASSDDTHTEEDEDY
jgi:hypothetical protein